MSDNTIAILGLAAMAAWVIVSCWRYHWKWEAFDRGERIERLEVERERLLDVTEALTADLTEADLLATKQARRSLEQKERIAELESRGLPYITEPREATPESPPIFTIVRGL